MRAHILIMHSYNNTYTNRRHWPGYTQVWQLLEHFGLRKDANNAMDFHSSPTFVFLAKGSKLQDAKTLKTRDQQKLETWVRAPHRMHVYHARASCRTRSWIYFVSCVLCPVSCVLCHSRAGVAAGPGVGVLAGASYF